MQIWACDEWSKLRGAIVGIADYAQLPIRDRSLNKVSFAGEKVPGKLGPYPRWVVDEAGEDLDALARLLKSLGVVVIRPEVTPMVDVARVPNLWYTDGLYNYCPRDSLLVWGDSIIETPCPLRSRYFEYLAYRKFSTYVIANELGKWVAAPKPVLRDETYSLMDLSKPTLMDVEPLFDAANVLKLGNAGMLYQVSNTGNKMGAKWLRSVVNLPVLECEHVYNFSHIDTTIVPLREGLVMLNASRVTDENCPAVFKKWGKVWVGDEVIDDLPAPLENGRPIFQQASKWIGMNILMVDPRTAIVADDQPKLIKLLKGRGVESIPIPMRHTRTLGGGGHCVTLDFWRD